MNHQIDILGSATERIKGFKNDTKTRTDQARVPARFGSHCLREKLLARASRTTKTKNKVRSFSPHRHALNDIGGEKETKACKKIKVRAPPIINIAKMPPKNGTETTIPGEMSLSIENCHRELELNFARDETLVSLIFLTFESRRLPFFFRSFENFQKNYI